MNAPTPNSIRSYLQALRLHLVDADPAVVQDALYDAEEYLRGELAENPQLSEADVVSKVARSYGAPEEVAQIYLEGEIKIERDREERFGLEETARGHLWQPCASEHLRQRRAALVERPLVIDRPVSLTAPRLIEAAHRRNGFHQR